jgi:hypothetical protein
MNWVLVILTLAGGTQATQRDLAECTRNLLLIETSRVREAYCVSVSGDRVYYVKHGRVVGLE